MTDEERIESCRREIKRLRGIVREYENEENKIMNINIKKLSPNAIVPTFGTEQSAGMDLYALIETEEESISANKTKLIHTGISIEIPDGYVGLIFARSGLATKRGLAPANKVGVIDSDYRGEIMVALHNHTDPNQTQEATIQNGERIAQLVIVPYVHPTLTVVDDLTDTTRGNGGFGSTGTK